MTKTKILKRLRIQQAHEGETADIKMLFTFLKCATNLSQWQAMVLRKEGLRYGEMSYEVHPFYAPTETLKELLTSGCT